MRYSMDLLPRAFDAIEQGGKTFEIRVNDERYRPVRAGDEIEFTKLDASRARLVVNVVGRQDFPSYATLVDAVPLGAFSSKPKTRAEALAMLERFFPPDKVSQYGLVAFRIQRKPA